MSSFDMVGRPWAAFFYCLVQILKIYLLNRKRELPA